MKKTGQLFSLIFTIAFCVAAFSLMIFFSNVKMPVLTEKSENNVLKSDYLFHQNILFKLPPCSLLLNFSESKINILFLKSGEEQDKAEALGYGEYKTISADYDFLAGLIDRLGGLESAEDGTSVNLSGADAVKTIYSGGSLKEITEKLLKKCADGKASTDILNYILENSETDLSFPLGYDVLQILPQAAQNLNFINEEFAN